jgi:TonB-dependent starch-binding outer membrane protein SusC
MKKTYSNPVRGVLILMMVALSAIASFAQNKVTGKINDGAGNGIPGATVLVKGTNVGTTSDATGNYSIAAATNNTLVISSIGFKSQEVAVGNRSVVNFSLEDDAAALAEVVVTGYQQLRKKDITGAATIVETGSLKAIKSTSFTQNLAGRAAGVTVSSSGAPGDATNVRIRGISSFTNNDPLYIIDGVPVKDQYQNTINPEDIESMQILKDAAMASIYGSRANNGVIVITTKKGKSGKAKLSYNGSVGIVNSVKGYDEVLNTSSSVYAQAMKKKFPDETTAWYANPSSIPKYIQPFGNTVDESTYDILNNQISLANQTGTNWWETMTRTGKMTDHNINLSGGNDFATFNISAGYLHQDGVFNHNYFDRGTIRANSSFKVSNKLRVGENMMYAGNWGVGLGGAGGSNNEQGVLGSLLKATPVIPQYDIKGNPGGHLTASTGNFTNPDQILRNNKNNTNKYNRLLGNIYAEFDVISGLTVRTSFGGDFGNGFSRRFSYPEPYRVEGNKTNNNFNENWNNTFTWTWTNTAQYNKTFADKHAIGVLVGQEAVANKNRNISGTISNYFTEDINAWYLQTALADPGSRSINSSGGEAKLASYFGKIDYAFDDKYLISATVRQDGSSKFLSAERYGIFPAVSAGWRISQESFMKDLSWLSDLKIRASYGIMGNQDIRNYNFSDIYGGGVGSTFYDINGQNGGVATGYALTSRGNAKTKWEQAASTNFGLDAALLNNSLTVVLDIYNRKTIDLLYNPPVPGTAGAAQAPTINVGEMENKGFDLTLGYRKVITKDLSFNTSLNVSQYKNKIVKVSDNGNEFVSNGNLTERFPQTSSVFINRVGYPISSFQGFIVEGLIANEADRAKHTGTGAAYIGGLKFKDVNGDGEINQSDNAIIGSPHPDFTAGLNLGVSYKMLDVNAFLFGSFGNDIFNATLIQSYFMNFNSNVIKDILEKEGTGNYPKINGLDASSRSASTFYVEDGSYVRLANLQVGLKIPKTFASKLGMSNARVYLQGQNLFTLTKYSGVDPAVSNANIGNAGNVNDQVTGYDNGNYPANKIITLGINLEF